MPERVGVNREAEMGLIASASNDFPDPGIGHRASALGREDVGRNSELAP
jgi:hypothetical protein